jgi:hypothetical protein
LVPITRLSRGGRIPLRSIGAEAILSREWLRVGFKYLPTPVCKLALSRFCRRNTVMTKNLKCIARAQCREKFSPREIL